MTIQKFGIPLFLQLSLILGAFAPSLLLAANGQAASPAANMPMPAKRDPFTTSDRMYAEQGIQTAQKNNPHNFVPGLTQGLPKMRLKGFVTKNSSRNSTALLDIEGAGVYMVSRGDEIGLHALGMNNVLKIVEVTANGVKVQAGQMNQVILVR